MARKLYLKPLKNFWTISPREAVMAHAFKKLRELHFTSFKRAVEHIMEA